jgi:serine/threonine protein kinase
MPELIAGKYEVLETIGRGGMGTVYKASQRNLDRVVAIKMLSEELAADADSRARFQQEATIVARLNHPNIVAVYDIEPHNHTFCIIMEYLEGESLQAKIDRDVVVAEHEALGIGAQIARALHYAHARGIIHRDVKPDNIFVTRPGVAKIMDFGIARFLESKLKTQTGVSMGTPKFMSPEQVTGRNIDAQTDVYSLGVCLYFALAGRPPFDGENAISIATRHLYDQPVPPSEYNTAITPAAEKVVMKALEKSKAVRYSSADEMADALDAAAGAKTPIRLAGPEGVQADLKGATRRMPAHTPRGTDSEVYVNETPLPITPSGIHRMEELLAEEKGPASEPADEKRAIPDFSFEPRPQPTPSPASGQPQRRWWLAVIVPGLVIVAAVFATRNWTGGSGKGGTAAHGPAGAAEAEYERIKAEEVTLLASRKTAEAVRQWEEFRRQHPEYAPPEIEARLDQLTAQLPAGETSALAERRERKGRAYVNSRNALAKAYLEGARTLRPGAKLASLIELLDRELTHTLQLRDAERASRAQAAFARAEGAGFVGAEMEAALRDAVELDPENWNCWLGLAACYRKSGYTDDARVALLVVQSYASGEARQRAARELRELDE